MVLGPSQTILDRFLKRVEKLRSVRKPKAELRVELIASTLLESSSQGKLRSMKDEIFRWKVTIAGITSAD